MGRQKHMVMVVLGQQEDFREQWNRVDIHHSKPATSLLVGFPVPAGWWSFSRCFRALSYAPTQGCTSFPWQLLSLNEHLWHFKILLQPILCSKAIWELTLSRIKLFKLTLAKKLFSRHVTNMAVLKQGPTVLWQLWQMCGVTHNTPTDACTPSDCTSQLQFFLRDSAWDALWTSAPTLTSFIQFPLVQPTVYNTPTHTISPLLTYDFGRVIGGTPQLCVQQGFFLQHFSAFQFTITLL